MGRFLGLDYGAKTVGVSVSDPLFLTAQPVETVWREKENHLRKTMKRIQEIVSDYQVSAIVLGCPRNMDGSYGERCEKTLEFSEMLKNRMPDIPVILWDERLTTSQAEQALMEGGVRRENRKQYLDSMAAVLILQNYLDYRSIQKDNSE